MRDLCFPSSMDPTLSWHEEGAEVDVARPSERVSDFDKSSPRPVAVLSMVLALSLGGFYARFPPLIPVLKDEKSREAFLDEVPSLPRSFRHCVLLHSFSLFVLTFLETLGGRLHSNWRKMTHHQSCSQRAAFSQLFRFSVCASLLCVIASRATSSPPHLSMLDSQKSSLPLHLCYM